MDRILLLIKTEPVMVQGAIQVTIALLTSFGLQLKTEQVGAIMAFTSMVLAMIARAFVTSNHETARQVEIALNTPVPPKETP